ncbi:hypothetical protein AVENLUH5627_02699 [Acinetobacter venetianus]|uniref:Phage tail tape measure protein n=1 Tax=Acinetobacter venetianus TaxID=52133 RepID=A0A150HM47_9GAMM|nr:hypothetical protein [Acinetobacter venetianus]KXZ65969.1 hypothetical protein AVENLUH5627_02699 [Acinetobacter venetianus]
MATKLGTLTLDLVAKIGNFTEPLNQAERKAKQTSDSMSKNLKLAASAAGILAGGIATASTALLAMAVDTAKADTELAILANRANISTTNFQILSSAATQLGVTQDQLGSIFADVQEKLGEFSATGAGGAIDFFDALKNNTKLTDAQIKEFSKTLQGKDGIEAVQLLKDKLDELGATSQEQRFVFESLASDLGNLMPLFSEGGSLLGEYGKALEDAGVIKTQEAIEQSKVLAAYTQALNIQFEGAKNQLVAGFTPALVDVADAMFGTSKNGSDLQQVGQGLGEVFKYVAATAIGVAAAVQTVGDGLGALTAIAVSAAKGDFQSVVSIYKDSENQFDQIISNSSARLDRLFSKAENGKATSNNLTNAILQFNQAQANQSTGLKVNTKDAEANAKSKAKVTEATKAATQAQNAQNKAYQDAVKLAYDYGTEYQRIEHDLTNEIKTIRESSLGSGDKTKMIAEAKEISEARKKVYLLEYQQDLDAWNWSEDQKLAKHIAIEKARVIATKGMSKEERQLRLDSFDSQLKQEQAWLELEKQQRLLDARQFYMSDAEYMQERYRLERLELEKIKDDQERNARIAMSLAKEEFEKRKNLKSASIAWGQSYADMTGTGAQFQIEQDRFTQYDQSNALFEAQIALANSAAEREAIWQAHNDRMRMIDENYWNGTKAYQLGMAADVFGGLSGAMLNFVEESSSSYQALVAIQKGANLASVLMNSVTAISAAWASAPFPYNLPAVAMATVETGALQATLQAFTPNISGMAHNGIDNIPKEGTWLLDGGERVLNPEQNKDLTNYLSQAQNSSGQSQVNLNPNFVIVDERESLSDYLFSPDGTKAFVKFFKRNRSALGV